MDLNRPKLDQNWTLNIINNKSRSFNLDLKWTKQTQISQKQTKIVHTQQKKELQNRPKMDLNRPKVDQYWTLKIINNKSRSFNMDLEWTKQTQISLTWTKIVHKQQKQELQNRNKIRFQDVIKVVDKLHKSHIQKPFIQIYYHSVSKLLKMHVWALYSQSSK